RGYLLLEIEPVPREDRLGINALVILELNCQETPAAPEHGMGNPQLHRLIATVVYAGRLGVCGQDRGCYGRVALEPRVQDLTDLYRIQGKALAQALDHVKNACGGRHGALLTASSATMGTRRTLPGASPITGTRRLAA